ncbi:MAG: peptidoglycan-binding domain-containing protein [Pseudomonadota bacterium]
MTSSQISQLQQDLRALGLYGGPSDGILSPRTDAAIRAALCLLPAVPRQAHRWPAPARAACCHALLSGAPPAGARAF